jgi:hypothetical protein
MVAQLNQPSGEVSVSTSSARQPFTGGSRTNAVTIYNGLSVHVHVRTGDSTVVATGVDNFIPGLSSKTFLKNTLHTHIAILASSGSGTALFAEEIIL